MPHALLFLAHTPQRLLGCRFFLLKYLALYNLKPPAGTEVIIYTNAPEKLEGFTNFIKHFEMRSIALLPQLPTKTAVLHQSFVSGKKAALFCDRSTYPLQALEPLWQEMESGKIFLHHTYRNNENDLFASLKKFFEPRDKTEVRNFLPPATTNVWSTAVVGIRNTHRQVFENLMQKESTGLKEAARDYLYTQVMQAAGIVHAAKDFIFDYSNMPLFEKAMQTTLQNIEEESIPNQVKAVHHVNAAAFYKKAQANAHKPFYKKWLDKIVAKK